MIIINPIESHAPIGEFNFEGVKYQGIKPGESLKIDNPLLSKFMLETWGFLISNQDEVKLPIAIATGVCPHCGRNCKTKLALGKHLNKCDQKPKIEPPKEMVGQIVNPKLQTRSEMENNNFYGNDGIIGNQTQDMIAGRKQEVTVDRDGVSWYGPGATDDLIPTSINKNKDFG